MILTENRSKLSDTVFFQYKEDSEIFIMHVPYSLIFVNAVKNPEDEFYVDYDSVTYIRKNETRIIHESYLQKMLIARYVFFRPYNAQYIDVPPEMLEIAYQVYKDNYENKSQKASVEQKTEQPTENYDPEIDLNEMSKFLHCDYSLAYDIVITEKKIPHVRYGRNIRVKMNDVANFAREAGLLVG